METPSPQDAKEHADAIIDRFTQTAESFGQIAAHSTEESLQHILRAAELTAEDTVLDVACGPGIIACLFAPSAEHVTGVDITPAMIEQARVRQKAQGLTNVSWACANLPPLPYPDASFSRVVCRYAFHHMLDPQAFLNEMVRVCRPGGRVVVADVYSPEDPAKAAAYNHVEKLRDSSHTWIQPVSRLEGMIQAAGLEEPRRSFYSISIEMEEQLRQSGTPPKEAAEFRRLILEDLAKATPELGSRRQSDGIHFYYPIVVLSARR